MWRNKELVKMRRWYGLIERLSFLEHHRNRERSLHFIPATKLSLCSGCILVEILDEPTPVSKTACTYDVWGCFCYMPSCSLGTILSKKFMQQSFFYIINEGVRASLRAYRLILQVLKLTTIWTFSSLEVCGTRTDDL